MVDQWIYIDTTSKQFYEYDALSNKLKKWWTLEEISQLFYPVYELSPKTTAFVVNFPGRNVWAIEKNDVAGLWNGVLDLYGISCN